MEYVGDGTLKEAIDAGLTDDQSWRIFRQIVEALVHITSLGIMHRDLKPSNVLMFGSGDVKIGDFGLATSNLAHNDGSGMAGSFHGAGGGGGGGGAGGGGNATQGTAEMVEGSGDLTSDIGTNLYIAPEVAKRGGAKYNGKVDMYSVSVATRRAGEEARSWEC